MLHEIETGEMEKAAVIKVIGVGGWRMQCGEPPMVEAGLQGVEFIAVNTDRQAFEQMSGRDKDTDRRKAGQGAWRRSRIRGRTARRRGDSG